MNLEKRLDRIEQAIKPNALNAPRLIFIMSDSDEETEEKIKELKKQYGEDYSPSVIIRRPKPYDKEAIEKMTHETKRS